MTPKIEKMPSKIHTYSGRWVDPLDLQPDDIWLGDIAHHLSNQCRWSGATRHHYSVAQHTFYASYLVPGEEAYDALHHDDPEYVLQDMAKPLKNHITLGRAYRSAERKIEKVIGPLLGVRFPVSEAVAAADLAILCAEADQLMHGRDEWMYYQDVEPADVTITKWTPERAEKMWLARHAILRKEKDATA